MIRLFLLNLLSAIAYLWCIEHNRYICIIMWFVVPMLNALVVAWKNAE